MKVRKLVCPCCGAKINKNQEKCDYCGASVDFEQTNENFNDNSTMEIRENGQNTQNTNIIIKNDTNSSNDLQKEVDEIVKNTEQPQKHTAKRNYRNNNDNCRNLLFISCSTCWNNSFNSWFRVK